MTVNTKLRISDLDFNSVKAGLVDFLRSKSEFTDYNFQASGISSLLDVLAYNTHYQGLMANFLANEMFIDTAIKRSSIVSHAKALGYTPNSMKAASAKVNIRLTNVYGNPASVVIPLGTKFSSKVNNTNLMFNTRQSYSANRSNDNSYNFSNVEIYEGEYVQNIITWDGIDRTITIPNVNVDMTTLRVWITNDTDMYEEYTRNINLISVTGSDKVYFAQEGFKGQEIYFGDGILGFKPTASVGSPASIKLTYISTHGDVGNNAVVFTLTSSLGPEFGAALASVTAVTPSVGGASLEDAAHIKLNALSHFSSQNRAVIADDYTTLIQSIGINTRTVLVWGGEDNTPPKYGTVMICVEPIVGDYITDQDKAQIEYTLKRKSVMNTNFIFVNPEYIDLVVDCNVSYNILILSKSTYELESNIASTIANYATQNLISFDSAFRQSNLASKIDIVDEAILSNTLKIRLMKKVIIGDGLQEIKMNFNNALSTAETASTITSSKVNIQGVNDVVWLEDDKRGNLMFVTVVDGVKFVVRPTAGTINYSTGVVYVNPVMFNWVDGTYFKIFATPVSSDIFSHKNSILRLTTDNIHVNAVA